ncbi:hypothetical protein CK203_089485 [Vitis vinifera]|uniref:Uncharacterized protein n=1 Tax=Vitis vinifera TaxID=29760 RepID=A0A438FJ31_VITVI|nr:hypothetical protein CK203_089485 [Vitis vinifera]
MATHVDKERWRSTYDQQYPNIQVPFSTVFPGLSAVIAPKDGSIKKGWSTYCDLDSHDPDLEFKYSRVCSSTNAHTSQLEDTTITVAEFVQYTWKGMAPMRALECRLVMTTTLINGNPSGSVLDDLHEWGLEDTTIRRSIAQARPRESVHEDVNNSISQDTIIRSFHEAEPRGIGYSPANSHAWYQERPWMPPNPDHYIRERNPAGGSVLDDHHEGILEDTIIRRKSLHQGYSSGIGYSPTDSHAWDQERLGRQPNLSISTVRLVFGFLSLVLASCFWLTFSFGLAEVMLNILHV